MIDDDIPSMSGFGVSVCFASENSVSLLATDIIPGETGRGRRREKRGEREK